jgi:hypothetical protein
MTLHAMYPLDCTLWLGQYPAVAGDWHNTPLGLARTVYIHRIWPYIWLFSCQTYHTFTVYIWFWPTKTLHFMHPLDCRLWRPINLLFPVIDTTRHAFNGCRFRRRQQRCCICHHCWHHATSHCYRQLASVTTGLALWYNGYTGYN